jgi:hypothetical protein
MKFPQDPQDLQELEEASQRLWEPEMQVVLVLQALEALPAVVKMRLKLKLRI